MISDLFPTFFSPNLKKTTPTLHLPDTCPTPTVQLPTPTHSYPTPTYQVSCMLCDPGTIPSDQNVPGSHIIDTQCHVM